jgi:hypothetical protein
MNKPELIESLNLLLFKWPNGISVELRRLTENGKAEIWSRYSINGNGPTLLDVSELNLLAQRSRIEYCNKLADVCDLPDFDWIDAFKWIVPMSLEAQRRGEPVIELGLPEKEIKRPTWDAYPFVVTGMPNIFFGDRGSLKSKLMLVLALLMMLPWDDNELGILAPRQKLTVLKLDYEATQDADEYEWHRILRGLDMEGAIRLKYRACRRSLADDVEAISAHADNIGANILIIDSLGPASGGDLNASEPALRFYAALRQLNRTSIIPAHTAKNQIGKRSVFGNIFYENLARNIWEVTKEEDEDSDSPLQHIALRQTKSPPFAPHHKPMAFEFDFDEDTERTRIRKYDANKLDVVQQKKSLPIKILDALKRQPSTEEGIAETTGESKSSIHTVLYRLKDRKKVTKSGDLWGLIENDL